MIHYFYGTLQVGIGQTLCSFEHVSCYLSVSRPVQIIKILQYKTGIHLDLFSTVSLKRQRWTSLFITEYITVQMLH